MIFSRTRKLKAHFVCQVKKITKWSPLKPIKIDDPDLRDRGVSAYCKQAVEDVFREGLKER